MESLRNLFFFFFCYLKFFDVANYKSRLQSKILLIVRVVCIYFFSFESSHVLYHLCPNLSKNKVSLMLLSYKLVVHFPHHVFKCFSRIPSGCFLVSQLFLGLGRLWCQYTLNKINSSRTLTHVHVKLRKACKLHRLLINHKQI